MLAFARIGCTSFGGGSATIAAMRQMCVRRGWMTEHEFVDTVVLSRLTPGISILAQVLLIGRTVCGVPGMIAGIVGLMTPSIAITITLAWIYELISGFPGLKAPLHAVAAIAAGFAIALTLQLLRDILRRSRALLSGVLFLAYVGLALVVSDPLLVMGISIVAALVFPGLFDIPVKPLETPVPGITDDHEH
jgi:chromate transporter